MPSRQLTELPGETFEDIFRDELTHVESLVNPKTMTGSDWDAILSRTRSTETKGES